MDTQEVIKLARELFKIRMSSANEGSAQDDGIHKSKAERAPFYSDVIIETWYKEALRTAEIIIGLEELYLKDNGIE